MAMSFLISANRKTKKNISFSLKINKKQKKKLIYNMSSFQRNVVNQRRKNRMRENTYKIYKMTARFNAVIRTLPQQRRNDQLAELFNGFSFIP